MAFDLTTIGSLNPESIQQQIDAELAKRGLAAYVEWVRYVPQGAQPPADATHVLSLTSTRGGHEGVFVAIKAKGLWATLADAALALV